MFLRLLIRKLPLLQDEDFAAGLLSNVEMVFYRPKIQETTTIVMEGGGNGELKPSAAAGGGTSPEPDMAELDKIVSEFNARFGQMTDEQTEAMKRDMENLKQKVSANETYRNSRRHSDIETAMQDCRDAMDEIIMQMQMDDENSSLWRAYNEDEALSGHIFNYIFAETFSEGRFL